MTDLDLAALRRTAEAAEKVPGDWQEKVEFWLATGQMRPETAAYLRELSPPTVIALLDELAAQQKNLTGDAAVEHMIDLLAEIGYVYQWYVGPPREQYRTDAERILDALKAKEAGT